MKKEEGAAVDSSAIFTLPFLSGPLRCFVLWAGRANRDFSKPSGDTHKIPEKTNCRRDRDFQTTI